MGPRRSTGTNMLLGDVSPLRASFTTSEPMPTSLPSRLISAAPLHSGWAGTVKRASSSRYSQLPANARLAEIRAGAAIAGPPKLATSTGSPTLRSAELPSSRGGTLGGTIARSRPKPVS